MNTFEWILAGLGLAFMLEGAGWSLFPDLLRRMVVETEPTLLRKMGLVMLVSGLTLIWLTKRFFHDGP